VSGHYIFRQRDGQYESTPYSEYINTTVYNDTSHQRFSSQFGKRDANGKLTEEAWVTIELDPDYPVVKVEVDLKSLPELKMSGYEVVVDFHDMVCYDTKNEFYTDSNGLEMQKRVLNHRPTWDI